MSSNVLTSISCVETGLSPADQRATDRLTPSTISALDEDLKAMIRQGRTRLAAADSLWKDKYRNLPRAEVRQQFRQACNELGIAQGTGRPNSQPVRPTVQRTPMTERPPIPAVTSAEGSLRILRMLEQDLTERGPTAVAKLIQRLAGSPEDLRMFQCLLEVLHETEAEPLLCDILASPNGFAVLEHAVLLAGIRQSLVALVRNAQRKRPSSRSGQTRC